MLWARLLSLAVLLVCATCVTGCAEQKVSADRSRDIPGTFHYDKLKRTYVVHVPPGDPVGLVLNLHGGGGTGIGQQNLTRFNSVADAANLVVVYPDGYDKSWADGRGAAPADRRHLNDVGFLVALVERVQKEFDVPAGHIFATGMSNGGFMSNRLACDRADLFAAIAPISGTLGVGVPCNPSRPVSVLAAHGTADRIVPFNGGKVRGRGGISQAISVANSLDRWRAIDGCKGAPSVQNLPDVRDGTRVRRFDSTGCKDGTEVVFYQIDDGGHTWPGSKQYLPKSVIGLTTRTFDSSQVIAQFFLTHGRD
ncbi:extracellular catalytic domain type 1 short-chain-length polyhydroxyalkanoate depolymerase [Mycobacterium bourgelatii]|uniref:Esterase n=1 Tax=Mycobacterium bourgelatii TaxID=1273442 RepID=A0A7I9YJM6_MYCBU|nr:PHB depolymerase family esterase [Mycobacterium bourgelatii]MCV6973542.1 PHB depolymerase family esterase [Mycobacterium bourgelatii]GFG88885.1 esterase [Mycobacterium bourgelatii]